MDMKFRLNLCKCLLLIVTLFTFSSVNAQKCIDLGLPSGTLWCDRNVGVPSEYVPGDKYNVWYSIDVKYTSTDRLTELEDEDDKATKYMGAMWCTPSYKQVWELINYCTVTTESYNGNQYYRYTGPNGNSILMYSEWYATRTLTEVGSGQFYIFYKGDLATSPRTYARPIRPVARKGFFLSSTTDVFKNRTVKVDTAFYWIPSHKLTWTSSDTKVANVDNNGVVTALSKGKVTITATATDDKTVTSSIDVKVWDSPGEYFSTRDGFAVDTITLTREGILGAEALKLRDNLSEFKGLVVSGPFDEYDWKSIREMTSLEFLDVSGVVCDEYPSWCNSNVKYVVMSDWIDEINGNPFESGNLTYLYIPKNVTKLTGDIHRCGSRMQLEGCEGVEVIGNESFAGVIYDYWDEWGGYSPYKEDSGVYGDLYFPSLKSLGSYAFYGSCITGVSAPLLEDIPYGAFCATYLTYADLPEVKTIHDFAFARAQEYAPEDGSWDYDYDMRNFVNSCLTTINIPSVEHIYSGAFYGQSGLCSVDISTVQDIGYRAFYDANLTNVNVPNVTRIDGETFYNCNTLKILEAPRVIEIGANAFGNCSNLETANLSKLESVGDAAFQNCTSLKLIDLPKVTYVGAGAFYGCSAATEVNLSDKLTALGDNAFFGCTNVGTVTLPASIVQLNTNCFSGSNNIKTINCNAPAPPAVGDTPFTMQTIYTATLFVPSSSIGLYQTDKYWKHFSKFEVNPTVLTDLVLASHSVLGNVRMDKINLTINPGASMSMGGNDAQDFRSVVFKANGSESGMFLSECERITSDDTKIELSINGLSWYFFTLPFNATVSTIENSENALLAIYSYDGSKRANNGTGYAWTRVADNATLTAGVGYIIQASKATTLTISAPSTGRNKVFLPYDVTKTLAANTSSSAANAGWNFIGNPYLTYYDIAQLDYDAPITVWTGSTYVAYTPNDDEYALKPMQPFFVQCPTGVKSLKFKAAGRQTTSTIKHDAPAAARGRIASNANRQVVDIAIANGENVADRTRFVVNSLATDDYDLVCDAAKMMSMDENVAQIYTIGRDVQYAINEGPQAEGIVKVGFMAPQDGTYTLKAVRANIPVMLYDAETEETVNLAEGDYSFETEAGTNDNRFRIILGEETTSISGIADADTNNGTEIFDLSGRKTNGVKGVNIIRQNGSVSKTMK